MKHLLLLLILICMYDTAKSQWVTCHTSTELNFTAIEMVDNNTAYATGSSSGSRVAKTTDGGLNWVTTTINASVIILHDIKFLNHNTGFVAGQSGVMYKTTNGGANWQLLTTRTLRAFRNISIVNEATVYGSGDNGMARKTTDGGVTWDTVDIPANNACTGMAFTDANTGFITCFQSVYKTTNGGDTWQATLLSQLYGIEMFNASTGFATGYNTAGYVYKTTNTGNSWNLIATGLPPALESTFFTSASTGYVYGFSTNSYIAKTTNGGVNWNRQVTSILVRIGDMDFSSRDTGMAVGGSSIMFTGNGGGSTSINIISSEVPSQYSLSQNYPNPFNPSTRIKFGVPKLSFVRLAVYDMLGKEISSLVNEQLQAGTYEYEFNTAVLNSGIYFYRLSSDVFSETKRMILIK